MAKLKPMSESIPLLGIDPIDVLLATDSGSHHRTQLTMDDYFKFLKQKCIEDGELTLEMKGPFLVMKQK